jgi:hypothetical protein
MTDERWEEFVESANQRFENVGVSLERWLEDDHGNPIENGTKNVVEFSLPQTGDNYKVVRENRPAVIDKKQHYSHRQGDTARTEYILSDTEFSHKVRVYKENDYGEWEEVRAESLGL